MRLMTTVGNVDTSRWLMGLVIGLCALALNTSAAYAQSELKLTASDGAPGDELGWGASIEGDVAIVSSPFNLGKGAAYVFERTGGTWTEVQKLTAFDGAPGDQFGVSVGLSGNVAMVAAVRDDDKGTDSGSVYVFERTALGSWNFKQKLTSSDGAPDDRLGSYQTIAIEGDFALLGARRHDAHGIPNSGAVYAFKRDAAGFWHETQKLTASDAAAGDHFGDLAAMSGNYAVVGADGVDDSGPESGAAYIFERDASGNWHEVQKLTAGDPDAGDHFGGWVAMSGNTALVAAWGDGDPAGPASGSVYAFERDGAGNWNEVQKLTASDPASGDIFGWPVAVQGDTALIAAESDDDFGSESGAFYVFRRVGGVWTEVRKIHASDATAGEHFGDNLDLDGTTVLAAAWSADALGTDSGAFYVIELDTDGDGIDDSFEASFGGDVSFEDSSGDPATVHGSNTDPGGSTITTGSFSVHFPQGTTAPSGQIDVKFKQPPASANIEVEIRGAVLPPGTTKTIEMPFGNANLMCIVDEANPALLPGESCTGDFRTTVLIPDLGDPPIVTSGEAQDPADPSRSVPATYTVTRLTATKVRVEGMVHTVVAAILDSDFDGLTDDDEVNLLGTDPNDPDTDGDGLLDGTEVDLQADSGVPGCPNPLIADSDGDLLADGSEVTSGTDPCSYDTDADGLCDLIDTQPTNPAASSGAFEDGIRALADQVETFDLLLFSGPNNNANRGRRNSLASRIRKAGNRVGNGQNHSAISLVSGVLAKVDGQGSDWMSPCPESTFLATCLASLLLSL